MGGAERPGLDLSRTFYLQSPPAPRSQREQDPAGTFVCPKPPQVPSAASRACSLTCSASASATPTAPAPKGHTVTCNLHTHACVHIHHTCMCTPTHAQVHTPHTRLDVCVHSTHTHVHTCLDVCVHTCTHMHRYTPHMPGYVFTHMYVHKHVCTGTHTTRAWMCVHITHMCTHVRMYAQVHTTRTCLDVCVHITYTCTYVYMYAQARTSYTHAQVYCVHIMHICIAHAHMPRYTPHAHALVHTLYTHACVHTLRSHMCVYITHTHVFTCTHHYTCACSHVHMHALLHTLPCPPECTPTLPGCPGSGPVALLQPHHTAGLLSLLITQGRAAHHTPSPAGPSPPDCFPMQAPRSRPHSSRLPRQHLCSRRPSTAKTLHSRRASILSRPLRSSLAAPASVRTFWLSLGVPVPPPPPTPRGRLRSESELHCHSLPAQGPGFSLLPFLWRCHSLGGLSISGPAVCLKAGHLTSLGLNSHTSGQGRWTLPQLCTQPWPSHCTQVHKALWPACWGLMPSLCQGDHGPSLKTHLGWKHGGVPKT